MPQESYIYDLRHILLQACLSACLSMAGKLAIHISAVKHNRSVPQFSSFESMGSGSFSTARTCSDEEGALHITYRSGLRAVHCLGRARMEGQANAMSGVQS